MPTHPHRAGAAAPLPSPIAVEGSTYFTTRPVQGQHQQQYPTQQQRQPIPQQQAFGFSGQHSGPGHYPQRQASASSTDSDASLYLKDFNLIAEAAKRAQVACVTRDFEEFGL